mgnify:CR=1 FL=1
MKSKPRPEAGPVLLALGGNKPHHESLPRETLESALAMLAERGAPAVAVARWRKTPAFPRGSGPDFVNGAARLETALSPQALLALLHDVEARLGRARRTRWEPRTCDLDLIAYGDMIAPDPGRLAEEIALGPQKAETRVPERLILPHPRMQERAFVLAPLADVAPDWRHPMIGLTVAELLAAQPEAARDEIEMLP